MRALIVATVVTLWCGQAFASGGIACEADDDNVVIRVDAGLTRGMGSAMFSFDGRLTLKDMSIAQDLRAQKFGREHVAQYWLDGDGLKLRLYRERDGDAPHGYVDVAIQTVSGDSEQDGTYTISVYDMRDARNGEAKTASLSGEIDCFVE
jgi:hypothetical protein